MSDASPVILHHFDASPFAEKVRLALGIKGLSWRAVEIPMVMPKPELTALTGGYRKTPVMQIGADVYCDTQRIAQELERRFPAPSLFPEASEAMSLALGSWGDSVFFRPGAALSMATNDALPKSVLKDREAFFSFLDFSTMRERIPHFFSQFSAQLHLVESWLADGRRYLTGDAVSWADVLAYFPLWMGRGNIAQTAELTAALPFLSAWETRMQSVGHGAPSPMTADEALGIAAACESATEPELDQGCWPQGLAIGDKVHVISDDYGAVPVAGDLLLLTHRDIAVRRTTDDLGEIVVHFPRVGYEIVTD